MLTYNELRDNGFSEEECEAILSNDIHSEYVAAYINGDMDEDDFNELHSEFMQKWSNDSYFYSHHMQLNGYYNQYDEFVDNESIYFEW